MSDTATPKAIMTREEKMIARCVDRAEKKFLLVDCWKMFSHLSKPSEAMSKLIDQWDRAVASALRDDDPRLQKPLQALITHFKTRPKDFLCLRHAGDAPTEKHNGAAFMVAVDRFMADHRA